MLEERKGLTAFLLQQVRPATAGLLTSPSPRPQDTLGAAVGIKHQVNMVGRTWLPVLQVRSSKALSTFTSSFARKTFPPSSLGKKWYHLITESHRIANGWSQKRPLGPSGPILLQQSHPEVCPGPCFGHLHGGSPIACMDTCLKGHYYW